MPRDLRDPRCPHLHLSLTTLGIVTKFGGVALLRAARP